MKILIAIHGSHSQPEQMQAQRETCLADLQGADYRYFLGLPAVEDPDVVCVPHPDGPIWEPRNPSQRTLYLNRKTEAIAQYALENEYDFVFKCDDDTYCNSDALLNSGFEAFDYSGHAFGHWTPATGEYQWAQGGSGYWLSARAIEIVANNGLHRARAEDFAVGQVLALHDIHPHHDARYIPEISTANLRDGAYLEDFITLHKINPEWMHHLHSTKAIARVTQDHMATPNVDDAAGE